MLALKTLEPEFRSQEPTLKTITTTTMVVCVLNPSRDRLIPRVHWSVSLAVRVSFLFSEDPISR